MPVMIIKDHVFLDSAAGKYFPTPKFKVDTVKMTLC